MTWDDLTPAQQDTAMQYADFDVWRAEQEGLLVSLDDYHKILVSWAKQLYGVEIW
jgi:hypothetical protein